MCILTNIYHTTELKNHHQTNVFAHLVPTSFSQSRKNLQNSMLLLQKDLSNQWSEGA